MALAVAQILASSRSSGTSLTRTYAGAVSAGSLLVAHSAVFNGSSSVEPTVSDTVNGTWTGTTTTGYAIAGDAGSQLWLWSFANSAAGTPQVTMDPPGTNSDNDLTLFEITGAATTSPRDVSVTNTGISSAASVATGTLAQAAEILISSFSHVNPTQTLTPDTADGFTQADENESNSTGQCFNVQYKIVASTASVTVDGTIGASVGWFTGVVSFKEAAAGGGGLASALTDSALVASRLVEGVLTR